MSIEEPLKILLGLGIPGSRRLDGMMFWEGVGEVVGPGQWSGREEGKAERGRVVAVMVERKSVGVGSWAFLLAKFYLLNSLILCSFGVAL